MIAIIKGSQRDPLRFDRASCLRLSRLGGLCKGFTGAVAHKVFTSVPHMHGDRVGIGTTEWFVQKQTCTWLLIETYRITPHFT